jgi:hypothetical protein
LHVVQTQYINNKSPIHVVYTNVVEYAERKKC